MSTASEMTYSQVWTQQIGDLCRTAERQTRLASLNAGARVAVIQGEINRDAVLDIVRRLGDVSIKDVAEATGLTRETSTKHLRDLLAAGLVRVEQRRWWLA
jgi:DNA-binding transcriptional ArsR family regulator